MFCPLVSFILSLFLLSGPVLATQTDVEKIKAAMTNLVRKLTDEPLNQVEQHRAFSEFTSLIMSSPLNDNEVTALMEFANSTGYGDFISNRHSRYEAAAEKKFAIEAKTNDLTSYEVGTSSELERLVKSELNLIPPDQRREMLFVGCGSLPSSAIFAQKLTGTKMAVCDCDQEALELAEKTVRMNGLSDKFQFIPGRIENASLAKFDVVWIAAMVQPRNRIVKTIAKTMKPNTNILVRQATGIGQLLYGPFLGFNSDPDLKVLGEAEHQDNVCFRTLMLKSKK